MNTEVAIILTVGGIAGSILITQLWQMNWFKKENFKFSLSQQKRADSIKFRKLERDLGLKKGKKTDQNFTNQSLIELLTNLDVDKIKNLTGLIQKEDETDQEEEDDDIINGLLEYAKENPEIANNFLKQLNIGGSSDQGPEQKFLGEA